MHFENNHTDYLSGSHQTHIQCNIANLGKTAIDRKTKISLIDFSNKKNEGMIKPCPEEKIWQIWQLFQG